MDAISVIESNPPGVESGTGGLSRTSTARRPPPPPSSVAEKDEGSTVEANELHLVRTAGDDPVYHRFSKWRRRSILVTVCIPGFVAGMDFQVVSAAIPEIAATFETTGVVVNVTSAISILVLAISPIVWGPLLQVYGRRWIAIIVIVLYTLFSLGTALSPNLAAYAVFRALTSFEVTTFFLLGSSCIGDIYAPSERATAVSWFLLGTVLGPAIGPFFGGVIVTYRSWRVIFWLQAALGLLSSFLIFFCLPETIRRKQSLDAADLSAGEKAKWLWARLNPMRVLGLVRYPNLLLAYLASSSLLWNQQCLLTPIRYVINPRFNLTSPLLSGLFYLAPGGGYLVGVLFGGRLADREVRIWRERRGERVPEDRLHSTLIWLGLVTPGAILVYGWTIEKEKGGIPVPVIAMFLQGVAQMACFPSLNTYCLDVMPDRSAEVIAGAYFFRYLVSTIGTASVLPGIETIGLGGFSTLSAAIVVLSAFMTYVVILKGRKWREDRAVPSTQL